MSECITLYMWITYTLSLPTLIPHELQDYDYKYKYWHWVYQIKRRNSASSKRLKYIK